MRPFDLFSTFNMDLWTDQPAYFPKEMQFYISVMFLGFPDKIHKEKPSFLDFENNWLRTDGPTDRRTDRPSYRDARTHLKSMKKHKKAKGNRASFSFGAYDSSFFRLGFLCICFCFCSFRFCNQHSISSRAKSSWLCWSVLIFWLISSLRWNVGWCRLD